ncbi:MAG: hypothetical protein AB7E36_16375 [Salinivirgaceae bacterium]
MKATIIFILFAITANSIFAQDFEVSPIKLYFNAEPGESQTKFIRVKNHKGARETYILAVNDLAIDSKGKTSFVDAGSLKNSIADWVSFAPAFFELNPNEEKEISITIQQPADDYGSKWGIIMVRTAQEQTAYSADKQLIAGLSLSARIAVNIYQTPGTNKEFKATISNLNEVENATDSTRMFNVLVNNLGEIITPCKVVLIATNIETVEEFPFNPIEFTMYPKSSRKVELELPNTLPKGTYSLAAILDYGSKTNLEGTQIMINVE